MSSLPVKSSKSGVDVPRGVAAPLVSERCRELATEIHDHALQSIALCLLQTELAKRMWDRGEPEKALAELQSIAPELESTAMMLREVMNELITLDDTRIRSA